MPQDTPGFTPVQQQPTKGVPGFTPVNTGAPAGATATPGFTPVAQQSMQAPSAADWQSMQTAQQPFPEWLQRGLETANKYAVEPFEKMAHWGGEMGAKAGPLALQQMRSLDTGLHGQMPQELSPAARGIAQGVGQTLGSTMADPRQIPLMLGSMGTSLPARAAQVGFATQMGAGVNDAATQLGAIWDREDISPEEKYRLATQIGLGTVMAAGAGAGAMEKAPIKGRVGTEVPVKASGTPEENLNTLRALQQKNVAIEGTKPVIASGNTGAKEIGGAKGSVLSDTARVPDAKSAKIQEQQVRGAAKPAWEAGQRDFEIERLKGILRNPDATPEERAIAQSQLEMHQQATATPQEKPVATQTAPSTTPAKAPGFTPVEAPREASSTAQAAKPKPIAVGEGEPNRIARQIEALKQQPTRKVLPKQTPEEIAADRELLENAQKPAQASGETAQAKSPTTPQTTTTSSEPSAKPGATEPVRGASGAKGETQALKLSKDSMGIRWAEDPVSGYKVSVPSRIADADIETFARPKLAEQADIHSGIKSRQEAAPETPVKAPGKPQDVTSQSGKPETPMGPQRPLQEALKPKSDPGQRGAFSLGGKTSPTQKASKRFSKKFDLTLQELSSPQGSDYLRAVESLRESTGSAKDYEELYHHGEDSSVPLNQRQQALKPEVDKWDQEAARIHNKLTKRGVPLQNPQGYVHRIALDKNTKLEKVLTQGMKYSSGVRLSKSASGLQGRTYYAMDGPGLGRVVVHESTNGNISAWVNKQEFKLGDKDALEQKGFKFNQATTKEIEQHSPQKYYKNALVSSILNTLELRRAERASDALEAIKNDPDFAKVAMKRGGTEPKGWGRTQVPQLENYSFEPRTREVLDRYWKDVTKGDPSAYEKINDWLRTSIFFNPLMHTKNIAVHWAVEKGVTGFSPTKWGTIAKTARAATRDVLTQNDNFKYALDNGAPLQSHRRANRELESLLITKMEQQLRTQPKFGQKLADLAGYANPKALLKGIYDFSNKATWTFDDIARLQATYQHMAEHKGTSFKDAMAEVNKHLPDYRIPTRILDSPQLSNLMRNKNITMFGAYHYGALKSYMEMGKDLVGPGRTAQERLQATNRLAMLGLMTAVLYPMMDRLGKKLTGQADTRIDRSGATTFIDNLYRVARGEKGMYSAGHAVVTPSPLPEAAIKAAGSNVLSRASAKKPVPFKTQAIEAGKIGLEAVGPAGQSQIPRAIADRLEGKENPHNVDWKRFFWGMLGVRYGSDAPNRGGSGLGSLGGRQGLGSLKR